MSDSHAALAEEIVRLRAHNAELLAALRGLVNCPTVAGLGAHIRDEARHAGRPDELAAARAVLARAEANS